MKLFYHFLVLVAASLILVACANMFASNPEKRLDKPVERSGINLGKDSLFSSGINTRFIFSGSHYYNVLRKYTSGSHQLMHKNNQSFNTLLTAANYSGQSENQK
jgi:hypothetical protein